MLLAKALVCIALLTTPEAASIPEGWEERLDADLIRTGMLRPANWTMLDAAAGLFQGDISLQDPNVQDDDMGTSFESPLTKGQLSAKDFWLQESKAIPYEISSKFLAKERIAINTAIINLSSSVKNCVMFVRRTRETNFIYFLRSWTCQTKVGRTGGEHQIMLSVSCAASNGDIQHEVLHALGFFHEQARPDRGRFVDIYVDNIAPKMLSNFDLLPMMETYNLPYDIESVTHYAFNFFAKDVRKPTISPKDGQKGIRMGQRDGMTGLDAMKVLLAYGCLTDTEQNGARRTTRIPATERPLEEASTQRGGQCALESERSLPTFANRKITLAQCRALDFENCIVSRPSQNCAGPALVINPCKGYRLRNVTTRIGNLNSDRPITLYLNDEEALPDVFRPVRLQVVSLTIRDCNNNMTTSKLPGFDLPNLLHFGLKWCGRMVVHKNDFAVNCRLRSFAIEFPPYGEPFAFLERGTFTNLLELRHLEIFFGVGSWENVSVKERTLLLQLHCDCEYEWFRAWLNQHPGLSAERGEGEIFTIGEFKSNDVFTNGFSTVDCAKQSFTALRGPFTLNDPCT